MAGTPLSRVRRPAARLRDRPLSGPLRRCRPRARRRLEGTRLAAARWGGCFRRDRGRRATESGRCDLRSTRSGSRAETRPSSAPTACGGTGPPMGVAARRAASPPGREAAARSLSGRAAPERRRRFQLEGPYPELDRARRRCLHQRRDRERRGFVPSEGRSAACRRRHVRSSRALIRSPERSNGTSWLERNAISISLEECSSVDLNRAASREGTRGRGQRRDPLVC